MRESGGGGRGDPAESKESKSASLEGHRDLWSSGVVWKKKKKALVWGWDDLALPLTGSEIALQQFWTHIYRNKEKRADSENTFQPEGSRLHPGSVHYFVTQLCLNSFHIGHCSVPVRGLGVVIPSIPLGCSTWRSVCKAPNLLSAESTDSVVCGQYQTWQADF